jgi:hypothetical protein
MNNNSWKLQCLVFFLCLVSLWNFLNNAVLPALQFRGVDFKGYYDFAVNLDPRTADQPVPWFLYFPLWGLLFKPLTWFAYTAAKNLWVAMNIFMVLGIILTGGYLLSSEKRFIHSRFREWGFLSLLLLNYPPLWVTIKNGQINLVVLTLLISSFLAWKEKHSILAGILLAFAISTRYTPAIFLLFWCLKKEYKVCLSTLLASCVICILSVGLLGWKVHWDYWILFKHYAAYTQVHPNLYGNVTLFSLLSNLKNMGYLPAGFSPMAGQIGFSLLLLVAVTVVSIRISQRQQKPSLIEYGLWATVLPLISYFGENHHYLFALIGFMGGWEFKQRFGVRPALFVLLFCWLGVGMVYHAQNMGVSKYAGLYLNYLDGCFILGSALILCYLTYRFRSQKKRGI